MKVCLFWKTELTGKLVGNVLRANSSERTDHSVLFGRGYFKFYSFLLPSDKQIEEQFQIVENIV